MMFNEPTPKTIEVIEDCFCEYYLHEKTNYPREGLVEKKFAKGDVLGVLEKFMNCYGTYYRVRYGENDRADIAVWNAKPIFE